MSVPAATLSGSDAAGQAMPTSTESMPQNMTGPSTKPPARLATTPMSDAWPNEAREMGAVARLAEAVTPAVSASERGRKRSKPTT